MGAEKRDELGVYSELVAAILHDLVEQGLRRQDLSAEAYFLKLPNVAEDLESFDDVFASTMIWLRDEWFIRYDDMSGGTQNETCFNGVQPTSKCLSVLNKKIDLLGGMTGKEVLVANNAGEVTGTTFVRAPRFFSELFGSISTAPGK